MRDKRVYIGALVFLLLLITADISYGLLCGYLQRQEKTKLNYAFTDSREEVIILGSSVAYRHIIPEIIEEKTDLSTYNFAGGAKYSPYNYIVLNSILDRYKPKLVIWGVSLSECDDIGRDPLEEIAEMRPYYGENRYVEELFERKGWREKLKLSSSLYRYNSFMLPYIKQSFSKGKNYELETRYKGYMPSYEKRNKDKVSKIRITHKEDSIKTEYMKRIAARLKREKVDFILVQGPSYHYVEEEGDMVMQEISKTYGIPYFSLQNNDEFIGRWDLFKDNFHLNYEGAKIYTEAVVEIIKELYK